MVKATLAKPCHCSESKRALKPDSPSLEHTGAAGLGCIPCAIAVSEGPHLSHGCKKTLTAMLSKH